MNLTFKGFLKIYCAELAGIKTTNIRRLVNAANTDAPRVAEPLFVYSATADKLDHLLSVSINTWMYKDYLDLAKKLRGKYKDITKFLKSDLAPKRYAAVLDAYNAKDDLLNSSRRIVGKLRPKVESSLKRSGISKYKACKDLGINPGNFYAYMKGDDSKISEEIAYAVISLGEGNRIKQDKNKPKNNNKDKYEDDFHFRGGQWYIDIKFTDEEYKLINKYVKDKNISIDDLVKDIFLDHINNL